MEDFTEYTEVDSAGCITITATKINVVNCPTRYSENYIYKDFGANHFKGDFIFKFTIYSNNCSSGILPVLWIMSNIVDIPYNIRTTNADFLALWLWDNKLWLYEGVAGAEYYDSYTTGGSPFTRYITLHRNESIGTYGTLYCYIYSDAARTILLDTLSITLHKKTDFRYLFPFSGYSLGSVGYFWTGYIENLNLFYFEADKDKIHRSFFSVYLRETGTAIATTDYDTTGHWATFLANFTHIGSCAMDGINLNLLPTTIVADFGEELITSYEGNFEANFLQNTVADFQAIEDLRPKFVDILLVDNVNNMFIYIHNKQILIDRHIKSGLIAETRLKLEETARNWDGIYSLLHTLEEIPT